MYQKPQRRTDTQNLMEDKVVNMIEPIGTRMGILNRTPIA